MKTRSLKSVIFASALLASSSFADDGIWNQIEGNWDQLKGGIQEKWGELTGDDIDQLEGNREQLVGSIQEKYGIAQEEAESQVDEWADSLNLDM